MKPAPNPSLKMNPSKNEYIETLRGLAVFLITVGHVIGATASGGMRVADDSLWRYLFVSFNYVGIPLFTAIAGWVYALRPAPRRRAGAFMWQKVRRLLLPMICVGTLYFFVQYVTPGTNSRGDLSEIWKIYVLPYTVYWYLSSLFLLFGFIVLLDRFSACGTLRAWLGWLLVSFAGIVVEPSLSPNYPNVFGIWGAVCLLPYFLLGVGIRRFGKQLCAPAMKRIYLAGFLIGAAAQQVVWFTSADHELLRSLFLHIPIGMLAAAFLLTSGWHSRFLTWLGGYSYTIYLFHAFGTSAGRILLTSAGIYSSVAIFFLSALLGLGIPIVVDRISDRFPLLRMLFLGKKYEPRPESDESAVHPT